MKITKFKKTSKGRYKLLLDNGDEVVLYEDVIVNNNLLFNKELSSDVLAGLMKQNGDVHAYQMALNYISIRLRSEREVFNYLTKKQVSEEVINQVIARLKRENYLNDFNFAKSFCNDQIILTPQGPERIKNQLLKLGVNEDVVQEVVEELDKEIIREKLSNLMEKQIRLKKGSSSMIKVKLINYFINLGYPKDMILEEISSFNLKTDVNHLRKEYDKLYNKYKKKYEDENLTRFIINKLYAKGYSASEISKLKNDE